ncbi:MAG TPA: hypothetical protein VHM30_06155 [Gemmatimonadaceae bacterium]|nr:hypothetical protein [Gemmatimonadaceae bacterium]
MLVFGILAACGDKGGGTKPVDQTAPASVAITAGDNQIGRAGTPLGAQIVAQVKNAAGTPLSGKTVTITPARGDGTIGGSSSYTAVTDAEGKVQVPWSLGAGSVRQLLQFTAGSVSQRASATVDTTRTLYLSAPDTASVGDTVRVWTAVGLTQAPGEAWGALASTIAWGDSAYARATTVLKADSRTAFFYHFAPARNEINTAVSLPANTASNVSGGPRMYGLAFVVKAPARGRDLRFTLSSTALVGASTFTDLLNGVTPVGATVHIR